MIEFELLHPHMTIDHLGFLPGFLNVNDPRPAREQLDKNYVGGWNPMEKFKLNTANMSIKYPGDTALRPLAKAKLRDEAIYFYESAWLLILQPDGGYEVSRVD